MFELETTDAALTGGVDLETLERVSSAILHATGIPYAAALVFAVLIWSRRLTGLQVLLGAVIAAAWSFYGGILNALTLQLPIANSLLVFALLGVMAGLFVQVVRRRARTRARMLALISITGALGVATISHVVLILGAYTPQKVAFGAALRADALAVASGELTSCYHQQLICGIWPEDLATPTAQETDPARADLLRRVDARLTELAAVLAERETPYPSSVAVDRPFGDCFTFDRLGHCNYYPAQLGYAPLGDGRYAFALDPVRLTRAYLEMQFNLGIVLAFGGNVWLIGGLLLIRLHQRFDARVPAARRAAAPGASAPAPGAAQPGYANSATTPVNVYRRSLKTSPLAKKPTVGTDPI